MRRLRLLFVTPDVPARGISAAREHWWSLLARLAIRHHVSLLAFRDQADSFAETLPPGLATVHFVDKTPYRPDDPLALLPRTVAGGYTNPALRAAIAARLAADRYDIVQYEFSEMANLMSPTAPARTILTVHQIAFAQERPAWHAGGRTLRRGAVLFHRYLRELDFELRAVRRVDHVVTLTPEDAARLRRFYPDLAVSVSPSGVDCAYFHPSPPRPPEVDVLFVGNFGHPPNADAVTFLVREVMPRLGRPLQLRVVGRGMTPEVVRLARPNAVDVVGPVPDLRPHLAGAAVVAAPVRFGTGMRGKVLEALAMGRPVVTTSVGAEGLGAVSGQHLLIADGTADFTDALRRVLDDPALAGRLGAGGRDLVEKRFAWEAIAGAHDAIYEKVLRDPPRAVTPVDHGAHRVRALAPRLGHLPALGLGFALLLARGYRWHRVEG
jgi:glycosyltransferase involved in cell wall biosynthesis